MLPSYLLVSINLFPTLVVFFVSFYPPSPHVANFRVSLQRVFQTTHFGCAHFVTTAIIAAFRSGRINEGTINQPISRFLPIPRLVFPCDLHLLLAASVSTEFHDTPGCWELDAVRSTATIQHLAFFN